MQRLFLYALAAASLVASQHSGAHAMRDSRSQAVQDNQSQSGKNNGRFPKSFNSQPDLPTAKFLGGPDTKSLVGPDTKGVGGRKK